MFNKWHDFVKKGVIWYFPCCSTFTRICVYYCHSWNKSVLLSLSVSIRTPDNQHFSYLNKHDKHFFIMTRIESAFARSISCKQTEMPHYSLCTYQNKIDRWQPVQLERERASSHHWLQPGCANNKSFNYLWAHTLKLYDACRDLQQGCLRETTKCKMSVLITFLVDKTCIITIQNK